ncbi:biliverdin-producing heme oxygenase [Phenylobacterium sp.]|uniref:biliverdin-producing heme oxygenase n=1 Tax=Phenylobacterium sp. TaxID=1871053 RepID=UPI00301C0467
MISDAHRRLRDATRADHDRLERRVDILRRIARPEARRGLIEGFYGLHLDAEAAMAPWLADLPGLDFTARRRSGLLARDLAAAGGCAPVPEPFEVAGRPEALGLMYVLEGSTLGGQVIRREAVRAGVTMSGLGFLDPYGAEVGPRWKAFLTVVDAQAVGEDDLLSLIAGARRGFALAEARLCGVPAVG